MELVIIGLLVILLFIFIAPFYGMEKSLDKINSNIEELAKSEDLVYIQFPSLKIAQNCISTALSRITTTYSLNVEDFIVADQNGNDLEVKVVVFDLNADDGDLYRILANTMLDSNDFKEARFSEPHYRYYLCQRT